MADNIGAKGVVKITIGNNQHSSSGAKELNLTEKINLIAPDKAGVASPEGLEHYYRESKFHNGTVSEYYDKLSELCHDESTSATKIKYAYYQDIYNGDKGTKIPSGGGPPMNVGLTLESGDKTFKDVADSICSDYTPTTPEHKTKNMPVERTSKINNNINLSSLVPELETKLLRKSTKLIHGYSDQELNISSLPPVVSRSKLKSKSGDISA